MRRDSRIKEWFLWYRQSTSFAWTITGIAVAWIGWNFLPLSQFFMDLGNVIFNGAFSYEASLAGCFILELNCTQQQRLEALLAEQREQTVQLQSMLTEQHEQTVKFKDMLDKLVQIASTQEEVLAAVEDDVAAIESEVGDIADTLEIGNGDDP